MLTVRYREAGQTEYKIFVAKKLTYVGRYAEFALHDGDGETRIFIKPARLEVEAVVNAPDN